MTITRDSRLVMQSNRNIKKIFAMSLILSVVLFLLFWNDLELVSMHEDIKKLNVKNKICYVNFDDQRTYVSNDSDLKMIYFVTPTYPRPEQTPDLTRLAHTLMLVPRIHWIVADDQPTCSQHVLSILRKTGLPITFISSPKPFETPRNGHFARGVANRRAALAWIHQNVQDGILYFGDDDNTVDLELFSEIRQTKKVSMFPVGLIGLYGVSSPVVKNGKVVGFFDSWAAGRTFPVDMAGFAVNIKFLKPNAVMPYKEGKEEDQFLVNLGVKLEDIEPLASNCTKVLVWHTRTIPNKISTLRVNTEKLRHEPQSENFLSLLNQISDMGMVRIDPNSGRTPFILRNHVQYKSLLDLS